MATSKWTEQGPSPILGGANVRIEGKPQTGAIHVVLNHPTDANILWAGSVNGGIWKSTNAHTPTPTWKAVSDTAPSKSISSLGIDPKNEKKLVAGIGKKSALRRLSGELTGLLLSEDGGDTWKAIGKDEGTETGAVSLSGLDITGVAISGDIILAAADLIVLDKGTQLSRGIYRSTDGGKNFKPVGGLPTNLRFQDLEIDPRNPQRFYAAAAGANGGIFRSDDGGVTWTNITPSGSEIGSETRNIELAIQQKIDPADSGKSAVYFGVVNNGVLVNPAKNNKKGNQLVTLFRLNDDDENWTSLTLPTSQDKDINKGEEYTFGLHPGGQGNTHFGLAVDPKDPNIIYAAGDTQPTYDFNGEKSSIGAKSWTARIFQGKVKGDAVSWQQVTDKNANDTAPHADTRRITVDKDSNLVIGNDGGVYKLNNPNDSTKRKWTSLNSNLQISELHSIDYDANRKVILGGAQDNGTSETVLNGPIKNSWQEIQGGDGGRIRVYDNDPNYSIRYSSSQNLAGFRYQVFEKSKEGKWEPQEPAFPRAIKDVPQNQRQFITPLELNKVKNEWFVIGGRTKVYESANNGQDVKDLGVTLDGAVGLGAIAIGGKEGTQDKPDVLYVGTTKGTIYLREPKTTPLDPSDPLKNSNALKETNSPGNLEIRDIVLNPKNWKEAYALDLNTVWRTTDGGTNWKNITGDLRTGKLTQNQMWAIEYVAGNSGGIDGLVVGGLGGVYYITNPANATDSTQQSDGTLTGGPGWQRFGNLKPTAEGLPEKIFVKDLNYDSREDVLVAGTLGRGAWLATAVRNTFSPTLTPNPNPTPNPAPTPNPTPTANPNPTPEPTSEPTPEPTSEPTPITGIPTVSVTDGEAPETIGEEDDFDFDPEEVDADTEIGEPPGLVMEVYLDRPSTFPITVQVETVDGTAKAGKDYIAVKKSVTIDPGITVSKVYVELIDDKVPEPDKALFLRIVSVSPANVRIDRSQGKGIITSEEDEKLGEIVDGYDFDEFLKGGEGSDTIDGAGGDDTILGLGGDDSLFGGDDDDSLVGGTGNDTLNGGLGKDTINGGDGNDSIVGSPGNDSIDGGAGIDTLSYGTSPNGVNVNLGTGGNIKNIEVIIGSAFADTIVGSSSDESLIGNGGADILTGGGGNDTFILDPTKSGGSKIQGAAGIDNLVLAGVTLALSLNSGQTGLGRSGTSLVVDLNKDVQINFANDIEIQNFFASATGNVAGTGFIENVAGLSGNTILSNFTTPTPVRPPTPTPTPTPRGPRILTPPIQIPNPNTTVDSTFNGGPLNDLFFGTPQADALRGLAGNDTIYGLDGSDNIGGDDGNDSLFGNAGNDFIDAGNGDDIVYGGKGNDGILGGSGNDSLYGNNGADIVLGGDGNDLIFGGKGDDSLGGDAGDDSIFGQLGNDYLLGGSGNDVVNGGEGNDTIAGIDPIALNPGVGEFDTLTGGAGNDRFLLGDSDKIYYSGDGNAVISDFNSAEDAIVLSGIKADYSLSVSGNVTSIFLKKPGQSDDLIATVQGVTDLNLDRPYFTFI